MFGVFDLEMMHIDKGGHCRRVKSSIKVIYMFVFGIAQSHLGSWEQRMSMFGVAGGKPLYIFYMREIGALPQAEKVNSGGTCR